MAIAGSLVRGHLRSGNFRALFQTLGWDHYNACLEVELPTATYTLNGQAEKRGMAVFVSSPDADGRIPAPATRRRIEKRVAKSVHEHIIIYTDAAGTTQVWQWVKRETGKPDQPREATLHAGQLGEPIIQRLQKITFTLNEESKLDIAEVSGRVRAAFDVDRVTKRFYDRFKSEHDRFLGFVQGIAEQGDREWYASLMLNRLMFVYFIQKKGFLAQDPDYLRNRLQMVQRSRGKGQFLSFYRYFLLRLFHEGLGQSERTAELEELLGEIPYLNGGLFDVHQLEQRNPDIEIPDEAFENVFQFFDEYEWHLDTRPLRKDNEINPDVLGYIFEKYINQKQMGAYYTKEDITGYITRNTVIPFLFDAAKKRCAIAFEPGSSVWGMLRDNPDRYIYEAVRHGVDTPLPPNIAAGIHDVSKRQDWNRPADSEFALPTETWREHVARRERCFEVRAKLARGEVTDIDELVTLNLDIFQFAEDVIDDCESSDLLRAFYTSIRTVTVLDPTCGSGAFLFAALNILEPLYDACLERMEAFVSELDQSDQPHSPRKYKDFRETLQAVDAHPNRAYFILKSIILNNLYGVDIMEEAVEIAKLRLFLTLVAEVESSRHVEPLPDIDFNIRAGNTLVGFATLDEARASVNATEDEKGAVQNRIDLGGYADRIDEAARVCAAAAAQFRAQQDRLGGEVSHAAKLDLRARLARVEDELNPYLATEYGLDPANIEAFRRWRASHVPFHWFLEFFSIMDAGGFDVIIGNPPWKEYSAVRKEYAVRGYKTERAGNLHTLCTERSLHLRAGNGWFSFIVQLPLTSSSRMNVARALLRDSSSNLYVIPCDDRPGRLFDGLEHCRSVVFLSRGAGSSRPRDLWTTRYQRWPTAFRPHLFAAVAYVRVTHEPIHSGLFPKLASPLAQSVFEKVAAAGDEPAARLLSPTTTEDFVFYQEATQYWVKATVGIPYYAKNGHVGAPAHGRHLYFSRPDDARAVCALLNSSLFYLYFIAYGDCFHLSDTLTSAFPLPPGFRGSRAMARLGERLMTGLKASARRMIIRTKDGDEIAYDEYYGRSCKRLIDEVDQLLAQMYGFSGAELELVVNYDIKLRAGASEEV